VRAEVTGLVREAYEKGVAWAVEFFREVNEILGWRWRPMTQDEEAAGAFRGATSAAARQLLRAMLEAAGYTAEKAHELVPEEGELKAGLADHGTKSGQYILTVADCRAALNFGVKTDVSSPEQERGMVEEWKKVLWAAEENGVRVILALSAIQYLATTVCDVKNIDHVVGRTLALAMEEFYGERKDRVRIISGPRGAFPVELAAGSATAVEEGVDTAEISGGNLLVFEAGTGKRIVECKEAGYDSQLLCWYAEAMARGETRLRAWASALDQDAARAEAKAAKLEAKAAKTGADTDVEAAVKARQAVVNARGVAEAARAEAAAEAVVEGGEEAAGESA
jgi:hypothetical protein